MSGQGEFTLPALKPGKGVFSQLVRQMQEYVSWVRHADAAAILQEIRILCQYTAIWEGLPSGNRDYLEKTLHDPAHYAEGARKHLVGVWPHRVAYIYLETGAEANEARERILANYDGIEDSISAVDGMSPDDVFALAAEAVTSPEVDHYVVQARNQHANKRTLESMLGKYNRLPATEKGQYSGQKRKSVANILRKVIIPQLCGQVAKECRE